MNFVAERRKSRLTQLCVQVDLSSASCGKHGAARARKEELRKERWKEEKEGSKEGFPKEGMEEEREKEPLIPLALTAAPPHEMTRSSV